MSDRPPAAARSPGGEAFGRDDPLESIRAILLSEHRLQLEDLRRLLDDLSLRSDGERRALADDLAALTGRLQEQLAADGARLEQHQTQLEELATAYAELEALVPRSPDALVEQIKPVMGELVGQSIRERPEVMAEALGPVMGEAIRAQIRESRQEMIDALFPIIGATIQRAIAEFFREFQRNIDARLRRSSSPAGWLQGVWSRLRGVSASELTVRGALPFSLLQVFLVQHDSGLLLAHHDVAGEGQGDTDLIGGMLTAIRSFTEDSFGAAEGEDLDEIQYGDERILLESGPAAYLAVVIEGVEPTGFRAAMRQFVLDLHVEHGTAMRRFAGDAATLPDLAPALATFASQSEAGVAAEPGTELTAAQRRFLLLGGFGALGVVLLACFYLLFTIRLLPVAFPPATATATATLAPTDMPAATTAPTATATVTAAPSPTPIPPTPTATSTATPTASPEPSPTPRSTATSSPTPEPSVTPLPVLGVFLWSREAPSLDAALFRVIPLGASLEVLASQDVWLQVRWTDQEQIFTGWIPARWLESTSP